MASHRRQHSTPHVLPGLPLAIHLEIFWWLLSVNQDILNYGLTCKAIFCVFKKSLFMRYKRSLDKQGLRDNPHCDLPLKARWALLRDRTRTWFELDPVDDCDAPPVVGVLDVNNVALSPMAFVANFTRSPSDNEPELLIHWLQFPHQVADPSGSLSFEEGDCDSPARLSSMQNLKMIGIGSAVLEHNSYIYVIQANDPALASPEVSAITVWKSDRLCTTQNAGRMDLELPLDATISRVAVEAAGENLAITFQYSLPNASRDEGRAILPRLLVVDWKKFRTKLEINAHEQVSDPGLVFLSEELLLNPSSSYCVLNIYSILPATAFENGTAAPSEHPICSLGLPPLRNGNYISIIDCKCSPNPTAQDAFPRHVPDSMPFIEDPKQAIVVFAITVRRNDASKEWNFLMVVHRRALLDLVHENITDNSSRPRVIPWNKWGPSIVRWLPSLHGAPPPSWGQRIFELDNHTLHVLNFNPKEIESLLASKSSYIPIVQKPRSNIFPHEGAFKDVLIGRLPCIRQQVRKEVEADSAWFDGVRLLFEGASKDPEGEHRKSAINSLYFG